MKTCYELIKSAWQWDDFDKNRSSAMNYPMLRNENSHVEPYFAHIFLRSSHHQMVQKCRTDRKVWSRVQGRLEQDRIICAVYEHIIATRHITPHQCGRGGYHQPQQKCSIIGPRNKNKPCFSMGSRFTKVTFDELDPRHIDGPAQTDHPKSP